MEDLTLRQNEVKRLILEYREAIALSEPKDEMRGRVDAFREKLSSKGLPLYGEEVLACIAMLEDLIDVAQDGTGEAVELAMAFMLLGLNQELADRWAARDANFFTD